MNKYYFSNELVNVRRINKREARRRYNAGERILFCPVKWRPLNRFYGLDVWIDKTNVSSLERTFDQIVNEFEFYNCHYPEAGRYTAFYIKEA